MRTARAGRECEAELIGVEKKGVGVVDLEHLFLPVQSVLLLGKSVDETIAEGHAQCLVFTPSRFNLVSVGVLVFLLSALILVLVTGTVSGRGHGKA